MLKIATIVGARPQFIKCASVTRVIRKYPEIDEKIIHTGQHYDKNMSDIFFKELGIPEPDINLGIGSNTHAVQTANMLSALEDVLNDLHPDWVMVYGDTNSTMAAALAAVKLNIPVAHVEAGLRSFNREMPEEINRIVTDHVADLLFAPTQSAMDLLNEEGLSDRSILSGDVMYDSVLHYLKRAEKHFGSKGLVPCDRFFLATVHRQENTDNPERLKSILKAFSEFKYPVLLPLHPRTKKMINKSDLGSNIKITDPVGYLEMIMLIRKAEKILTDSGGLQKEAYFLQKQCITLRDETEWTETLENNWNILAGTETDSILDAINLEITGPQGEHFGNGHAGTAIINELLSR